MADEAFALSPITARPAQPSEADYEAIREAFMETSRGRWFLGEYAKRNRNADTRMVLDAVARIEETLAAQRQSVADRQLVEMLAAIRSAVDEAEQAADAALEGLKVEDSLAPIHRGVRIIKEISWRWREIGADARICDLIDSQVGAIETACGQVAGIDPRAALEAAFDLIKTRIDAFSEGADGAPAAAAVPADQAPKANAPKPPVAAAVEPQASIAAEAVIDASKTIGGVDTDIAQLVRADPPDTPAVHPAATGAAAEVTAARSAEVAVEPADVLVETAEVPVEAAALAEARIERPPEVKRKVPFEAHAEDDIIVTSRPAEASEEADTAHDEAVLKLVAIEMAAPDLDEVEFHSSVEDDIYVTRPLIEPMLVVEQPEPVAAPSLAALPRVVPEPPPAPAPVLHAPVLHAAGEPASATAPPPAMEAASVPTGEPQRMVEPSLGSTILANGLLQPPRNSANDPLAPIRRMSQAEKIALFS